MTGTDDVDGLLHRHSVSQLREWQAALRLDPPVEVRVEIMLARLCVLVANKLRGKDEDPYEMDDFLIEWGRDPEQIRRERAEEEALMQKRKMQQAQLMQVLRGEA